MKDKTIVTVVVILMITLLITSCSKCRYISKMSRQKRGKSNIEMCYDSFKGYKYKELYLHKGDTLNISIDIKTSSGKLTVKIFDEKNHEMYSVENPKEIIYKSFYINEDGKYKIKVEGEHSGSFNLKWIIQH